MQKVQRWLQPSEIFRIGVVAGRELGGRRGIRVPVGKAPWLGQMGVTALITDRPWWRGARVTASTLGWAAVTTDSPRPRQPVTMTMPPSGGCRQGRFADGIQALLHGRVHEAAGVHHTRSASPRGLPRWARWGPTSAVRWTSARELPTRSPPRMLPDIAPVVRRALAGFQQEPHRAQQSPGLNLPRLAPAGRAGLGSDRPHQADLLPIAWSPGDPVRNGRCQQLPAGILYPVQEGSDVMASPQGKVHARTSGRGGWGPVPACPLRSCPRTIWAQNCRRPCWTPIPPLP